MKIVAAASTREDTRAAAAELLAAARASLTAGAPPAEGSSRPAAGARVDLAFLFASPHHAAGFGEAAASIARGLEARHLAGATGESIIAGAQEHEGRPALALWAACLPGAEIRSGHVTVEPTPEGVAFAGTPEVPAEPAAMILIGDPYSFPADAFIERLAEDRPDLQILGGMASGARDAGESQLAWRDGVVNQGAIAVSIWGAVRVRPLVSQGCRPFGKRHIITRAQGNAILELGGRPAGEKLAAEIQALSPTERTLLGRGLHVGLAIDARKREHRRGDFLVRNVIGFSRETGAIAISDLVKPGVTVQFHLRDAETASEDLDVLLRELRDLGTRPQGGLLFSCNGRGSRLFDVPHHDAAGIARALGAVPLAGFFAAGEIGPVGGRNFLHGFTASLALFEENG
jgi:small ligand-binding sensory domain FIST